MDEIKALLQAWKDIDWPDKQHRDDQLDYILKAREDEARKAVDEFKNRSIKLTRCFTGPYPEHERKVNQAKDGYNKARSALLKLMGVK